MYMSYCNGLGEDSGDPVTEEEEERMEGGRWRQLWRHTRWDWAVRMWWWWMLREAEMVDSIIGSLAQRVTNRGLQGKGLIEFYALKVKSCPSSHNYILSAARNMNTVPRCEGVIGPRPGVWLTCTWLLLSCPLSAWISYFSFLSPILLQCGIIYEDFHMD